VTDAAAQEIESLVEEAAGAAAAPPEPEEATDPPKKKRRVARPKKEQTLEELEVDELLEGRVLPKAAQNVKTIGDMYAKYRVGDDPDFKVQVWRTWPKMFPGGKKADGYYDTWETPLSLEQIQSEYGGGTYRIAIIGPHPSQPRRTKHYDSVSVQLAGDPKYERIPRALMGQDTTPATTDAGVAPPHPMMVPQESPKLAEAALKMIGGVAERERTDRHRAEERAAARVEAQRGMLDPVIDAERRRADDVLAAERRASTARSEMMDERYREERRAREELRHRVDTMGNSRSSFADELRAMSESGLLGNKGDGVAEKMLNQILDKHRGEMEAVSRNHTVFIESLRGGHGTELAAVRDAHRREMEAVREAARAREARGEERLGSEREERRRDQERYRETQEARDTQWKDRMASAELMLKGSWESRYTTMTSTYENRLQWAQGEIDRLKSEVDRMRVRREEAGDPVTQITKMAEMRSAMKDALGIEAPAAAAASSGGIGLSGGADDWKATLAEGAAERFPDIVQSIMGGFQKPTQQQPAQPNYQLGQVVPTPQGEMIVVQAPNGQMALAPRAAVEAHQRQQQAAAPPLLADAAAPQQKPRRTKVSAVPNLAEGLPRRRPAWEGGGEIAAPTPPAPPPAPPRHPPRMTSRPEPKATEPVKLSSQERQGIQLVAKLVHDSVMEADEPEEFVAKVLQQYPADVLNQIVGAYTTEQVAGAIAQLQPNSAGATPGGQRFVHKAFRQLRAALKG